MSDSASQMKTVAALASRADEIRRRQRLESWVVFALTLGIYLLTFGASSDGLILGNDVIPYARGLVNASPEALWNPHHLLFHPLSAAVVDLWSSFGGRAPSLGLALDAQRVISALGGATACLVVFRLLSKLCTRWPAGALTTLFAFSSGTWLYASVGETYLPATAALAAVLAVAIEMRLGVRSLSPVLLGGLVYLAVMLRQDSVLVVPALLVLLPLRLCLLSVGGAGMAAIGLYGLAWILSGSTASFPLWLRGLAEAGLWGGELSLADLGWSVGLVGASLAYGIFYFGNPLRLAVGLAGVGLLVGSILPVRRLDPAGRRVAWGLATFVLVRLLFYAWWQPGNMEYHSGSTVALLLLAGLLWNPQLSGVPRMVREALLALSVVCVVLGNCTLLIAPNRGDEMSQRASQAIGMAGNGGLVIALDRLQHYANLREEASGVELFDASDFVGGRSDSGLEAVRRRIDEVTRRGGTIVLVRDLVLPDRFELPLWPIVPERLSDLMEGYRTEAGRSDGKQRTWAWSLALR